MKNLVLTLALVSSSYAFAAATTEIWEGPGSQFDRNGQNQGNYSLVVENVTDGNSIQSHVTVTLADGSVHKEQCQMTKDASGGWSSTCDHGRGGGLCFGEGLCISYEANATGGAFATTIAVDGPSDLRMLRTELQNGQAVSFYREKLHKR